MKDYRKNQPFRWTVYKLIILFLSLNIISSTSLNAIEQKTTFPPIKATQKTNTPLLPFFDTDNNPVTIRIPANQKVDMTPPPPTLNAFDRAVLKTCGPFGGRVNSESFKQLFALHPDILRQIKQAVGGSLYPNRNSDSDFLEDLTAIWFNRRGFEHIFCGKISGENKISGLHFAARYIQLQNEGIGGRIPNNSKREEAIPGVVYTVGVEIKKDNISVRDSHKSYPYVSNAAEIIIDATKAFKAQKNTEGACIYNVLDKDTGKSYPAIFVKDSSGIITFYPDVTPKGYPCKN
ncbi:MAG: EndoU domain-containing protein [Oscillatoriaceae bacterium SKW80]|nr:EndoU domain-containing protein [Oscillatoriaceae bacterium SKYG93]MCX8120990.1 EndoU domain-containing protein [Oscillatoriaceae bacterium SKW80]MDW8452263.1 EndoU domain-containing protein [Oscillatoriaceae cyanobacterium SKYGB_i_bin93]HIK26598.1 EndoU domain-containing protein [Oscillatoriaceae cyanobacterium M7585_C2015_266]